MTIDRNETERMMFTTRVKKITRRRIEELAAKLSEEMDAYVPLGGVIDRAVEALAKIHLAESAESTADAADQR